jgi:hypothetical protein
MGRSALGLLATSRRRVVLAAPAQPLLTSMSRFASGVGIGLER